MRQHCSAGVHFFAPVGAAGASAPAGGAGSADSLAGSAEDGMATDRQSRKAAATTVRAQNLMANTVHVAAGSGDKRRARPAEGVPMGQAS